MELLRKYPFFFFLISHTHTHTQTFTNEYSGPDFPSLTTKRGKILWVFIVPVYWALAYIVASAVPNIGDISSLVGAFCIGNFTYTFPALLKLGFDIKKNAMLPEEHFDPVTKKYTRLDGGYQRWLRGFKKSFWMSSFNIVYFLGALVVCGLGCYAAIEALISAFGDGGSTATNFSCTSPFAG
jgi:Transmembrane amino acid transporter protein